MKKLSLLAIGNSFTVNAFHYLDQLLRESKLKNYKIAYLWFGGASLKQHYQNIINDERAYSYLKWESDKPFYTRDNASLKEILTSEKWEIITLQQVSYLSGDINSIEPTLTNLIKEIRKNIANNEVRFGYHYTWAYQKGSSHPNFDFYQNNQMKMAAMILKTIEDVVLKNAAIEFVIPAGAAIENVRKTAIGDNLNLDDGFHLNELGCYVAGLAWLKKLTKVDLNNVGFIPEGITKTEFEIIKKAVCDAYYNKLDAK